MARSHPWIWTAMSTVLGIVMIGSGAAKLVGPASIVESFAKWGLPSWFRILVGTFEVIGGALLALPATIPIGGVILATIMVGALWTHVANGELTHTVPSGIVLTLLLTILAKARPRAIHLLGGA
jgi:putative oxidoreductase